MKRLPVIVLGAVAVGVGLAIIGRPLGGVLLFGGIITLAVATGWRR